MGIAKDNKYFMRTAKTGQSARACRLILVLAGCTVHLLVLSCYGSIQVFSFQYDCWVGETNPPSSDDDTNWNHNQACRSVVITSELILKQRFLQTLISSSTCSTLWCALYKLFRFGERKSSFCDDDTNCRSTSELIHSCWLCYSVLAVGRITFMIRNVGTLLVHLFQGWLKNGRNGNQKKKKKRKKKKNGSNQHTVTGLLSHSRQVNWQM